MHGFPTSHDAAGRAGSLLRGAARILGTPDPNGDVGGLLHGALTLPAGHPDYRRRQSFAPQFSETAGGALSFAVTVPENGPGGAGGVAAASHEVRHIVDRHLGRNALLWFDRRTEAARTSAHDGDDASVITSFDRDGFREAQVTYLWGPWFAQDLPDSAARVATTVLNGLVGSEPAFTTIRAARTSGSQSMSFRVNAELPLAALRPVMDDLGLGSQHGSLMTGVALVLGARYTLPPGSALVTLRPLARGLEMRLDIDLEAIPDIPPNVAALLALQLGERPRSLRALEQWASAFTPDDEHGPGTLSVLSVTVRPDMGARLSVYLRPRVLTEIEAESASAGGGWR